MEFPRSSWHRNNGKGVSPCGIKAGRERDGEEGGRAGERVEDIAAGGGACPGHASGIVAGHQIRLRVAIANSQDTSPDQIQVQARESPSLSSL